MSDQTADRNTGPRLLTQVQPDSSILIRQEGALGPYPRCMTERFMHWADKVPDGIWMAERGPDGDWLRVSYASGAQAIRAIGSALLDLGLTQDRPLLILSGNSIAHAMMALAAQHVGIPSAAVAPAYALGGGDHGKLAAVVAQLTPGLVFADDATRFLPAIAAVLPPDVPLVSLTGAAQDRQTLTFDALRSTNPTRAMQQAHAAITSQTVAKFLFTSGTTGNPKAVIQTQGMLCSNQAMIAAAYDFLPIEPPVIVDWGPWNHTASGNKAFNMAIYNGGTFYIDDGRPTPDGIARTLRNLRDIAPTWYFNVPIGYQFLVEAMETDEPLSDRFFSRLRMMMYAGAGMSQPVWDRLTRIAERKVTGGVPLISGLGATETGPFALCYTDKKDQPGNIGVPALGVTLKLVPQEGKFEARLKSPSITPGYWRDPMLTRDAFDEDGFYKLGDALRFAVPGDAAAGFLFDGRLAENFKLSSGTWVSVGRLRASLVNALQGLAVDAVVVGEGRDDLRALLVPNLAALRDLAGPDCTAQDLFGHPTVCATLKQRLSAFAAQANGSASRIVAAMFLADALRFDAGEITEKGSVNQRAVLRERATLAQALWTDDPRVVVAKWKKGQ